jgi:hypothetical protein
VARPAGMSKDTFTEMARTLELTGDGPRMDALFTDVQAALERAAAVHDVDTAGVEPSPVHPWLDLADNGAEHHDGGAA